MGILDRMTTTIKVPNDLRARVQQHAQARGQTQAAVVAHALDLLDRETFFAQLRDDIAAHPETTPDAAERDAWLAGPVVTGTEA